MAIAPTVRDYLEARHIAFRLLPHPYAGASTWAAEVAHVPGRRLAKGVLLEDERGYVLAVVPSHCHVDLACVHRLTGRRLGLATESEVSRLFHDCDPGAAPPLGPAYGIDTIIDVSLVDGGGEVFFEAGDHTDLVELSVEDFNAVTAEVRHLPIAHDVSVHH